MAPALRAYIHQIVERPGARETQAAGRHGHFGLKSAPQHRDFRPGKVEDGK